MAQNPTATITRLKYRNVGQDLRQDALEVRFRFENQMHTFNLQSGEWSSRNLALQLMAMIGIQPSDFDDRGVYEVQEGDNCIVPIVVTDSGDVEIANSVFNNGKQALENTEWFV